MKAMFVRDGGAVEWYDVNPGATDWLVPNPIQPLTEYRSNDVAASPGPGVAHTRFLRIDVSVGRDHRAWSAPVYVDVSLRSLHDSFRLLVWLLERAIAPRRES
jgi:hypothetical protein